MGFNKGLTQKVTDKLTLDFGYSYIFVPSASINVGPNHLDQSRLNLGGGVLGTFVASADTQIHIVSMALRYRFGPEAKPLVTKN